MSAVEEITGEMRRLVLKSKTLESRLADSVPKKTYNDAVAKMQLAIDNTLAELQRTKKELESTETLGGRLNALNGQVTAMAETISAQAAEIKSLETKLSEGTVSTEIYNLSLARIAQLENDIKEMVPKSDYDRATVKISELEAVVTNYVPRKELDDLSEKIISITKSVDTPAEEIEAQTVEMDVGATTLDTLLPNDDSVADDSGTVSLQ